MNKFHSFYSLEEASDILGIPPNQIQQWLADQRLVGPGALVSYAGFTFGSRIRIPEDELIRLTGGPLSTWHPPTANRFIRQ